jgi:glycerophosphoryl diester phosphodiesterase
VVGRGSRAPDGRKLGQVLFGDKGYRHRVTDVIAHRGASRVERGNTVAAFERAVEVGAEGIELDVRRTADGQLVTHHDATLGDGRVIVETMQRELPFYVPTLADALDACAGAWVNIEIKNDPSDPDFDPDDAIVEELVAELDRRGSDEGPWLVSCFRLETVDRCRALAPHVPTAWLVFDVEPDTPAMLADRGHAAVHPWVETVTAATVERCHDAGLAVNTWTCNDPARARELAGWGIDGICTDVPGVLLDALRR